MALQDEQSWFEANRAFISQQYKGQYVLVKDQTVRGAYPTYSGAYQAGAQMFGQQPFLVAQAVAVAPVHRI
jgi:hypothetical protein